MSHILTHLYLRFSLQDYRYAVRFKIRKLLVKKIPRILLTSNIPGFSLDEVFQFAKEIGFDGIEYVMNPRDLVHPPSKVILTSRTHSLPIISLY